MAEGRHLKSILVDNKSHHAVTLYILQDWTKSHIVSVSFIVEQGKNFLFHRDKEFRFELRVRRKKKKITILDPMKWERDLLLRVTGDDEVQVKEEHLLFQEKQICLRRKNMKEEVSASGSKNLYEILRLNMKEVRGKTIEEQNEMIKKAYRSQLLRWHPDKNPENGDKTICQEIIKAYKILRDPEARAAYNNVADYDKGWLSKGRWRAVFKPECYTDEQKKQYKKRRGLLILSGLLVAVGVGLTFATAGMASPVVLGVMGSVAIGGGISSGLRTINRDSIENGCSLRKYFTSLAAGAVGGAIMVVGAAGIAVCFGGAAQGALKAAQLSLERQISQRMATTAFRGFITSLTNNLDAVLAGGPKTTWQKFLVHVVLDALLGGIVGLPGGVTENMIQDVIPSEGVVSALETISADARNGVEELATIAGGTFTTVLEERLDDDVENKSILGHIKDAAKQAALSVGKNVGKGGAKVVNAFKDLRKTTGTNNEPSNTNEAAEEFNEETNDETKEDTKNTKSEVQDSNDETKQDKCEENMDDDEDGCSGKNNETNLPKLPGYNLPNPETNDTDDFTRQPLPPRQEGTISQTGNREAQSSVEHRLKYISNGLWFSKMLIDYEENGRPKHREVEDSESSILIPNNATNIKVRFQVQRFIRTWCDVKKYDRFKKEWVKSWGECQPHIFRYSKPVSRTYTLDGGLYYEKVTKIIGECFDEKYEI